MSHSAGGRLGRLSGSRFEWHPQLGLASRLAGPPWPDVRARNSSVLGACCGPNPNTYGLDLALVIGFGRADPSFFALNAPIPGPSQLIDVIQLALGQGRDLAWWRPTGSTPESPFAHGALTGGTARSRPRPVRRDPPGSLQPPSLRSSSTGGSQRTSVERAPPPVCSRPVILEDPSARQTRPCVFTSADDGTHRAILSASSAGANS